jgi:hypothetical protein
LHAGPRSQDLADDSDHSRFSWAGATLWAVVLLSLVSVVVLTWRKYRAARRSQG